MVQAVENVERALDDLVLALVVQACHRTDATGIVFETWVVEARGRGSLLIEHMKVGVEVQTPA
jgi:hypothetical protein